MVEKIMQKEEEDRPEEGNRLFKLPKHIKQMGLGGNSPEIYIEDYAEGYLKRLAGSDYAECRVAVLVGEFIKSEGKRYVFIRGAIEAEDVVADHAVQFTSEVWAGVYEKIKRYFPHYEAVGWFLGGPEFLTEVTDEIRQTHVDWFGGRDRVLYKIDPVEKEAVFYLYDKGELKKWPGYCVYYEKNEEMQDYLVAGAPPSVDAGYKEPILAELSKRVGRKEDPDEPDRQAQAASAVGAELAGSGKEIKKEKGNGKHGVGIVAAMALLALGAFALREKEISQPGNAKVPTPVPPATGYAQSEDIGDVVQTHVNVKPTEAVGSQDSLEGSIFEPDFVPITEEPHPAGEEDENPPVTAAPAAPTEVPTKAPDKEDEVMEPEPFNLYIVQSGDTLAGICREFYGNTLRMEEIKGINQIPDENWIYAGQELYLP